MALEHPGLGFFGVCADIGANEPSLTRLDLFIRGYGQCEQDSGVASSSLEAFMLWLQPLGYNPTEGWAKKIIDETGDGAPAYDRFKELLFLYLESEKPQWFIEFNQSAQPSAWYGIECPSNDSYKNACAVPKKLDIRIEAHVRLVAKKA